MELKIGFEWFNCFLLKAAGSFLEVSDQCHNVLHDTKVGGHLTAASVRRPTCSASANTLGLALCCRGSNFFSSRHFFAMERLEGVLGAFWELLSGSCKL